MAGGEVGLHGECGLRRRRGAVAPTSRFAEKGKSADYRLKTRLSSSMALCACIRIHSWAGNHFKQLRLCKSGVGQDGIVTIPDQMFVIARQALAHTHFSASRLLMWPTVFLGKRLNLDKATVWWRESSLV
ncbi:hypothetical protein COCCADRAFT_35377 [Bipolaris zeicola 26-R-13]|uniref:Uncharacterized protein n=1 Tax=Cochliobolus carbonum (strain 26-R-13) TaxID=930089 RepID=W6Y667_COCC2|nr:uncharacterized protein COCCADRAFT_35377 [Bipolaris zeicola 26-R-13]EUC35032.1 hypothetical protein COCCADRAFT_35377 [Bipolaris zeicola 26-R-13]